LYEASLKASLAISGDIPVNSNRTLPGFTGALYISTDHLPQPIGTSNGLEVKALSGKILIQILPHLLIYLIMALLAASICLEVIYPLVTALSP
jgi:hypothetical protein